MCCRYVALSGRRSTMMSRIVPRVARTSFVSACGGYWKCIPRSVPLRLLKAMFACAITGSRPRSANSFWQNARAKKPRSSSRASRSTMNAPFSLVSVKITRSFLLQRARRSKPAASRRHRLGQPAQVGPEVSRLHELLELVDAPEARPLEVLEPKAQLLVRFVELPRALVSVPPRLERGQAAAYPREVRSIIALVRPGILR